MKKVTLILLSVLVFSCTKDNTEPKKQDNPTLTNSYTGTYSKKLIGNWFNYEWIVDEISQTKRPREIIIHEKDSSLFISINQYRSDTTYHYNVENVKPMKADSTYFDRDAFPLTNSYKGYLINDTSIMVYHYGRDSLGKKDTAQKGVYIKK